MATAVSRKPPPCALKLCRIRSVSRIHTSIVEAVIGTPGEAAGYIELIDGDLLLDTLGARRVQRVAWEQIQLARDELPEANMRRIRVLSRLIKELTKLITRIDEVQLRQFEAAR